MLLFNGTANVKTFCHALVRLLLLWKSLKDWSSVENGMGYHTFILQYYIALFVTSLQKARSCSKDRTEDRYCTTGQTILGTDKY